MGAAQSLETLDDMLRCDGCRGSTKDVPDNDIFNTPKPESKDERLARLVISSPQDAKEYRLGPFLSRLRELNIEIWQKLSLKNKTRLRVHSAGARGTKAPRVIKGQGRATAVDERTSNPKTCQEGSSKS
jgi:hypothetical protein